jgi:hypothetical protein
MKLNVRPLPHGELSFPEITAVSYETVHDCGDDTKTADAATLDFNIALYKQEKLLNWVQLCPCRDTLEIEFRNRFIDEAEECSEISEKILHFAEKWALQHGYEKITVSACAASLPYYLRMQYMQQGEPVCQSGNLLYHLVKAL